MQCPEWLLVPLDRDGPAHLVRSHLGDLDPEAFARISEEVSQQLVDRVNQLSPDAQAQWGKMSVAQMLKHCNVPFEMVYEPE